MVLGDVSIHSSPSIPMQGSETADLHVAVSAEDTAPPTAQLPNLQTADLPEGVNAEPDMHQAGQWQPGLPISTTTEHISSASDGMAVGEAKGCDSREAKRQRADEAGSSGNQGGGSAKRPCLATSQTGAQTALDLPASAAGASGALATVVSASVVLGRDIDWPPECELPPLAQLLPVVHSDSDSDA